MFKVGRLQQKQQQQSQKPSTSSTNQSTSAPSAPPLKKQRATATPVKAASTTRGGTGTTSVSTHSVGSTASGSGGSAAGAASPSYLRPTQASTEYQRTSAQKLSSPTAADKIKVLSPSTASKQIEMEVNQAIEQRRFELRRLKERSALSAANGDIQSVYAKFNVPNRQVAAFNNGVSKPSTIAPQQQQSLSDLARAHLGAPRAAAPAGLGVPVQGRRNVLGVAPTTVAPTILAPSSNKENGSRLSGVGPKSSGPGASVSFAPPQAATTENHSVGFQPQIPPQPQTLRMQTPTAQGFAVEQAISGTVDVNASNDTPVRPRQLDLQSTVKKSAGPTSHANASKAAFYHDSPVTNTPGKTYSVHEASTPMTANRGRRTTIEVDQNNTATPPDTVLKRANEALERQPPDQPSRPPPFVPNIESLPDNSPKVLLKPNNNSSSKAEMFRTMMDYANDAQDILTTKKLPAPSSTTMTQPAESANSGPVQVSVGTATTNRVSSATLKRMAEQAKLKREADEKKKLEELETSAEPNPSLEEEEDEKASQTTPRLFDDDDDGEEEDDEIENGSQQPMGITMETFIKGFGGMVSPVQPIRPSNRNHTNRAFNDSGEPGPSPPSDEFEIRSPEKPEQFVRFVAKALRSVTRLFQSQNGTFCVGFVSPKLDQAEHPLFSVEEDTFATRLSPSEQNHFMAALIRSTSMDPHEKSQALTTLESFFSVQVNIYADKSIILAGRRVKPDNKWWIQVQHYHAGAAEQQPHLRHIFDLDAATQTEKSLYTSLGNILYIDTFGMEQEYSLAPVYMECMRVQHMFITSVLNTAWAFQDAEEINGPSQPSLRENAKAAPIQQRPKPTIQAPLVMGRSGSESDHPINGTKEELRQVPQLSPVAEPKIVPEVTKPLNQIPPEAEPAASKLENTNQAEPKQNLHEHIVDDSPQMDTTSALILLLGMLLRGILNLFILTFVKLPCRTTKLAFRLAFWTLILAILWRLARDDNGLHLYQKNLQHNFYYPANSCWPRIPLLETLWNFLGIIGQQQPGLDHFHQRIV